MKGSRFIIDYDIAYHIQDAARNNEVEAADSRKNWRQYMSALTASFGRPMAIWPASIWAKVASGRPCYVAPSTERPTIRISCETRARLGSRELDGCDFAEIDDASICGSRTCARAALGPVAAPLARGPLLDSVERQISCRIRLFRLALPQGAGPFSRSLPQRMPGGRAAAALGRGQSDFRSHWIAQLLQLFGFTHFLHANRRPLRLKTL